MGSNKAALSVIIPTYNEADNIPILLKRLATALQSIEYEVIVVDDNSPDRTWEVAESFARESDNLRVIRRLNERGLSSAVVYGMSVAVGSSVAVIDADCQHDESILPAMHNAVLNESYDVCVGSRASDGGSYGEWSPARRFISWVAATLARMMLPVKITDPMSGFFVISREIYLNLAPEINPRGFKILLEFIGRNPQLSIKEIGYTFRNRIHGETKLSGSVIKNYLIALYDLRFGRFISSTFVLYAMVGTTGVLVNMLGFALGEKIGLPRVSTGISQKFDPLYLSVPFGIQLSIITNYLLNNYLTFYDSRHRGWQNVKGLLVFQMVSLLGLIIQTGSFQLLHTNGFLLDIVTEEIRKYVNNSIGIIIATASNYYLNLNFTWKK